VIKRRTFVQGTAAAATAAGTGLMQIGCTPQVQPAPYVEQALSNGVLRVSKKFQSLVMGSAEFNQNRGGAITVFVTGDRPPQVPEAVLLVHRLDGVGTDLEWVAMNSACPHLGCPMGWGAAIPEGRRQPVGMVLCPCHQSRFTVQSPDVSETGECISVDRKPALAPPQLLSVKDDPTDPDNFCIISFDTASGNVEAPFSSFPALMQTGGAAVVGSGCGGIVVVRTGATTAEAYTATCTHLGCTVKYTGVDLICPCHNSRFDLMGRVLDGPAEQPLRKFAATVAADKIVVTIS
jgi:Rieske Fe-S protein